MIMMINDKMIMINDKNKMIYMIYPVGSSIVLLSSSTSQLRAAMLQLENSGR